MYKILLAITFFFTCLFSFSQLGQTDESNGFSLRINTGGTEMTYDDNVFEADTYFNTGNTLDRPQTGLPEPFQSFRFSRSQQMSYDIPLEDGEYTVNLYFAELWFGATSGGSGGVGSRVFDVSIEGELAEDNLDVFAEAGADAMLMKSHTVTVTGGVLEIDFDSRDAVGGERHPIINAIEIIGVLETDTIAPIIVSLNPMDDDVDVPLDNSISFTFNEPIQKGSGNITWVDDSNIGELGSRVIVTAISYINGNSVTIPRSGGLNPNVNYHLEIENDAFQDLSGNSFVGFNDATTWNFSTINTEDKDGPELINLSPEDNAPDVDIDSSFILTFNEPVQAAAGWVYIWERGTQANGPTQSLSIPNSNVIFSDDTVTINFPEHLKFDTEYNLQINYNVIEDLSGNDFMGTSGDEYNFKTSTGFSPFITTWKTDNPGTSGDSQITIPTYPGADYDYSVEWGDGTSDSGVTGNITHTYVTPGVYQVSISGDFPRIYFFEQGDEQKIMSVDRWGDIKWSSMQYAFRNCSNLDVIALDVPNLSNADKLVGMFANCTSLVGNDWFDSWDVSNITDMVQLFQRAINFNQPLGNWDVGNVGDMFLMFENATSFNQDISRWNVSSCIQMTAMFSNALSFNQDLRNWDVRNVDEMSNMFDNVALSVENYDNLLIGWSNIPSLTSGVQFHGGISQYCQGQEARQKLIDDFGWTITDAGKSTDCPEPNDFALRINTGGTETSYDENVFATDTYFNTGSTLDRPQTGLSEPFQTFRFSRSQQMSYDIPLEDGEYAVNLYFAELWFGATGGGSGGDGSRVFDVSIEGELAEDNLDVFAEAGADAILIKSHTVRVTDGVLDIDFDSRDAVGGARHPIINAIEILGQVSEPEERPFVTTWKTDNPGISEDNQITIYASGDNNDYKVDWGDGTVNTGVEGNIVHTYISPGTYQVSITGSFAGMYFNNGGNARLRDDDKIISIDQWGDIKWTWLGLAFAGCDNLDVKATDIPDFSQGPSLFGMFSECTSLIGNEIMNSWDLSRVDNTAYMFNGATKFNQSLDNWNVSDVDLMYNMFALASSFNQDISSWDVRNVRNMNSMFIYASSMNQDLSNWDVSNVENMDRIFNRSGLSNDNYDNILIGWSQSSSLKSNVMLGARDNQYCQGEAARQKLIDDFGWVITDEGKAADCIDTTSFITTWKTDNPGNSEANQILIALQVYSGSLNIDWGDGNSEIASAGFFEFRHTYNEPGVYTVSITGEHLELFIGDPQKLQNIKQWGDIEWEHFSYTFAGCSNLQVDATDIPDMSRVTVMNDMFQNCTSLVGNEYFNDWDISNVISLERMFQGATAFNAPIGNWDVSHTPVLHSMFDGASSFNQDLSSWDVSNYTSLEFLFYNASSFNQDISNWDVSNVENFLGMFHDASSFNQDISIWKTESATNFAVMFSGATSFNQDISIWNTSMVDAMLFMFRDAVSFDQNISSWEIGNVQSMQNMFTDTGLSAENYDNTLIGWSSQQLQNGVVFDGGNSQYCQGEQARQKLIDDFGWVITDGGKASDCIDTTSFITTWKTDNPGLTEDNQINIPITGCTDCIVDWGDGTIDTTFTHTYESSGTYEVSVRGNIPQIFFNSYPGNEENSDATKLLEIKQWGDSKWTSMSSAFSGCVNLDVIATDTPDLSNATSLFSMFTYCFSLKGTDAFNEWDISSITNLTQVFYVCNMFNADISDWDVSNVTGMHNLFSNCTVFNQDISDWNVSNVNNMGSMFSGATNFNQNISSWDVSEVTSMKAMFQSSNFNHNIGNWNVSNVTDMSFMFNGAPSFNQDLANWNVSKVTNMKNMFSSTDSFNQNIGDWNVSNVTDMGKLFALSTSFDQPLGNWDLSKVKQLDGMFFNSRLSIENYDSTLIGWSARQLQNGVVFDGGNNQYCQGEDARQKLIDDFGWVITDGGKAEGCEELAVTEIVVVPWLGLGELFSLEDGYRYPYFLYGGPNTFSIYEDPQNFKAKIIGDVGSVKFTVTGDAEFESQMTNTSFTLFTEDQLSEASDFIVPEFYNSFYTITATPYSEANFGGVAGESFTVSFEIYSTCYDNDFAETITTTTACGGNGGSVEVLQRYGDESDFIVRSGNGYSFEVTYDREGFPIYRAYDLAPGKYSVSLFVNDADCYSNYEFIIEEVADCPEPNDFALRINTGGTETSYNAETFVADAYFDTGRTLDRPQTGLPEPFQSFRYSRSQEMSYDIPLEDGEYTVNLYFAELWFGATGGGSGGVGSRVFDVSIEGVLAEDNLDIFAEVGADAMLMKSHTVNVIGGVLDIDFDSRDLVGGERHPVINAIEILGSGNSNSNNSPLSSKTAISNPSILSPNPVITTTTLSFEKPVELTTIQIFDVTGRLVHSYNGLEVEDEGAYILQVSDLESGTYFIYSVDVKGIKHQKQMVIKK